MVSVLRYIIISFFSILCFGVTGGLCADVVRSADVLEQGRAVERVFGEFLVASLPLRVKYEFGGKAAGPDEGGRLVGLCEKAGAKLEVIYSVQAGFKRRIEEYEGRDWDVLYGESRLWQRIYGDLQRNAVLQQRLEIYKAMGLGGKQRKDVLAGVIGRCDSKEAGFGRASGQILKARAVAVLGGKAAKRKALELLGSLGKRSEIGDRVYFEASLIKIYLGADLNAIDGFGKAIVGSSIKDDFELNLGVTVFELMYGGAGRGAWVKRMMGKWPGVKWAIGEVILEQLSELDKMGQLNVGLLENRSDVEISLVLGAAQRAGAREYRSVIEKICAVERFRTPLALYVYAEANVEVEPATAIRYYLKAAMEKNKGEGGDLGVGTVEIAEFAARLAYKLYYEDSNYLDTARLAMGFYCAAAGVDANKEIVYLYAGLLGESGRRSESHKLLEKISAGGGRFAKEARLDSIAEMIEESSGDALKNADALKELEGMMADEESARIRREALKLYCRILLEGEDVAAVRVLELLEGVSDQEDGDISLLRGVGLYKLGRFVEAVEVMAGGVEVLSCQAAGQVYVLLAKVLEQMDVYESQMSGFGGFVKKCERLGEFCVGCAEDEWKGQVELLWAEIAIFAGDDSGASEVLGGLEKVLGDNIDLVRCWARLHMERGQWREAFEDWVGVRRGQERKAYRDDNWWRAKYYELYCFMKLSADNKSKVAHAIEILEASSGGMGEFWSKRLSDLRRSATGQ